MKIPITIFKKYPATFMLAAENKKTTFKTIIFPERTNQFHCAEIQTGPSKRKWRQLANKRDILEP